MATDPISQLDPPVGPRSASRRAPRLAPAGGHHACAVLAWALASILGGCVSDLPAAAPGAEDLAVADARSQDARPTDQAVTDAAPLDRGALDQSLPDLAPRPDVAPPIDALIDLALPDAALPDQGEPDLQVLDAEPADAEAEDAEPADAGIPDLGPDEDRCNGIDDDDDGRTDEDHPLLGTLCSVGEGACAREGVHQCAPNGLSTACSARAGTPVLEVCGGGDADCNGEVDDAPQVGEACVAGGHGPCLADGRLVCAGAVLRCETGLPAVLPEQELCDQIDNDCDGAVDEVVGAPCALGIGACISSGVYTCTDLFMGSPPKCTAVPGEGTREVCDGLDNDCDGEVDNTAEVGGPCTVGRGACERAGVLECRPEPPPETGEITAPPEDSGVGRDAGAADGGALDAGSLDAGSLDAGSLDGGPLDGGADGGGPDAGDAGATDAEPPVTTYALTCVGQAGDGYEEFCDGNDNDCDGIADEAPVDVGGDCTLGQGACKRSGVLVCNGTRVCDAQPVAPSAETCNGVDDDCDGRVDEAEAPLIGRSVCGGWVQDHCRIWFGWADNDNNPPEGSPTWGGCPVVPDGTDGEVRCTNSAGDGRFHMIRMSGDVDFNDWLGVRFECDEGAVGDWTSRHCQVALTYSDTNTNPGARTLDPQTSCGTSAGVAAGNPRCVRSAGDRNFHPLQFQGDVNGDDRLGIAFFCDDPLQRDRAQAVAASVEVFFGFWDRGRNGNNCPGPFYTSLDVWGDCPGSVYDNAAGDRCVGRVGGTGFEVITPNVDVEACDYFSVALRARPANR